MKSYELAVKATKRGFHSAFIATANSHLAQFFRVFQSLNSLMESDHNVRNTIISWEALVSFFADKILSLCHNFLPTFGTVCELQAPWLSMDSIFGTFSGLSQSDPRCC